MSTSTSTWTLAVFSATTTKAFERESIADATTPITALPECKILCTDQDTIQQLVVLLCDEVVKDRREMPRDYSVDQHLWSFKILRPGEKSFESRTRRRGNEESCDGNVRPRMEITSPLLGNDDDDDDDFLSEPGAVNVSSSTKLGDLKAWGLTSQLHLEYDMGTTTNVFLRVIAQETTKEGDILGLISEEYDQVVLSQDQSDLEQIPAFSLPEEKQIDFAYPNYCQALLGKKEPVRFFTMGLCSKILRPDDTVFASIRGADSDVFFCPLPFDNMDEFMVLSEEGWKHSSEHAKRYRVGWVSYHIFPPNEHGKMAHQTCLRQDEEDSMAAFGPKNIFLYKDKICIKSDFRFSESFPRTAEQMASGRFRWFRYQKGVLQVVVGRSVRDSDCTRNAEPDQILRTWRRRFTSVHELLCAVEASWIVPGGSFEPLGKIMLPLYDTDIGPSDPLPPGPANLGGADDTEVISAPGRLPQVTALAVAREGADSAFIISGHKDGSLRKWNLNQSKCVWAIRHYAVSGELQKLEGYPSTGIRGIAIRKDPTRGHGTCLRQWHTDLFAVPLTFAVFLIFQLYSRGAGQKVKRTMNLICRQRFGSCLSVMGHFSIGSKLNHLTTFQVLSLRVYLTPAAGRTAC
jgi:hypothetical protein